MQTRRHHIPFGWLTSAVWAMPVLVTALLSGCSEQHRSSRQSVEQKTAGPAAPTRAYDIPRFAINSPFDTDYKSPIPKKGKRLWARSFLWEKAPDFVVEKWLTSEPEMNGKHLLIEFWATWCSQCRLAVPKLNDFQRQFRNDLVVMGISDEAEDVVRRYDGPKIEYHVVIDTQARMKDKLGVFGIPHCIIVEPKGHVVWEGFPLLKGHQLTREVIQMILKASQEGQVQEQQQY
ncbi:MAG: redoxin domain-containing protein [Phycisphaerales bacterium]|nr:MAG: redoxin domain-containing protein [Phycisphaerales bacterium]